MSAVLDHEMKSHASNRLIGCAAASIACSTLSVLAKAETSAHPISVGFGPALFFEDTRRLSETVRIGETRREGQDQSFDSDGLYNLQVWALTALPWAHLRGGAGLSWFNRYTLSLADSDDEQTYETGHLLQLYGQLEYTLVDFLGRFDALLGVRAGPTLVFPSGDLRSDLDRLDDQGYSVWPGPRAGVFVAPHLGGTWPLTERLSLRGDLSFQFTRTWLYDASASDGGITTERSTTLATTRTQLLAGLEFTL